MSEKRKKRTYLFHGTAKFVALQEVQVEKETYAETETFSSLSRLSSVRFFFCIIKFTLTKKEYLFSKTDSQLHLKENNS